jgi:hypothetical protein
VAPASAPRQIRLKDNNEEHKYEEPTELCPDFNGDGCPLMPHTILQVLESRGTNRNEWCSKYPHQICRKLHVISEANRQRLASTDDDFADTNTDYRCKNPLCSDNNCWKWHHPLFNYGMRNIASIQETLRQRSRIGLFDENGSAGAFLQIPPSQAPQLKISAMLAKLHLVQLGGYVRCAYGSATRYQNDACKLIIGLDELRRWYVKRELFCHMTPQRPDLLFCSIACRNNYYNKIVLSHHPLNMDHPFCRRPDLDSRLAGVDLLGPFYDFEYDYYGLAITGMRGSSSTRNIISSQPRHVGNIRAEARSAYYTQTNKDGLQSRSLFDPSRNAEFPREQPGDCGSSKWRE